MAIPVEESRKLLMNQPISKDSSSIIPDKESDETCSANPITVPKLSTPEAQKKRCSLDSDLNKAFEKTPETASKSPSSVLNPPSSLKRKTIRDYFLAAM